jgi:hypothetical protein
MASAAGVQSSEVKTPSPTTTDLKLVEQGGNIKPTYSALSLGRRRLILTTITVAGLLGPLAGNIYLPALPVLQNAFGVGETAINATVTAFMVVFAFAVRS